MKEYCFGSETGTYCHVDIKRKSISGFKGQPLSSMSCCCLIMHNSMAEEKRQFIGRKNMGKSQQRTMKLSSCYKFQTFIAEVNEKKKIL